MAESIKESCKLGVAAYAAQAREQWVLEWPGQVVLAVSAIFWTSAVTNALTNGIPGMLLSVKPLKYIKTAIDIIQHAQQACFGMLRTCTNACLHNTSLH